MAVLKCKMCGAKLNVEELVQVAKCMYCDTIQTIPKLDDDLKLQMFERATELRIKCEFEQAAVVFQNIISQFPEEAEAYWGLCLCKYGIEYVDDPSTLTKMPTCHRTQLKSILSDMNYISACNYAGAARYKYEEEAQEIDRIQKKILDISKAEPPYDIFICYKETDDETGIRTDDSITAQDIYTELVKENYRVFYSRISLRGKAGSEYEPYIYAALSSAQVMLVLGSKKEYFETIWLKNEWTRYLDMMQLGNKTIIPCYEKIDVMDLPVQLRHFQALNMESKIFYSDLSDNISRIIPKKQIQQVQEELDKNVGVAPQKKELDFTDGVYVGEALGTRPHGFGTRFFENGSRYEGNWNMGMKHGIGSYYWNNGTSWSGEWKKNKPFNGNGKYYASQNNIEYCYEGTIQNGFLIGKGKIYREGKIIAEGFFEKGRLNGQGINYRIDGKKCSGEFRSGRPWNAEGTYSLLNNTNAIFSGKWKDGKPDGIGEVEILSTGRRIKGEFKNGLNGIVKWELEDGYYEGEIKEGAFDGNGKRHFKNGNRYEGSFSKGKYNGNGTLYLKQGTWSGEWKDGKRWNGSGLIMYCDDNGIETGEFYNGSMINGKGEGKGIHRRADGCRFDGEFKADRYYSGTFYDSKNQPVETFFQGTSKKIDVQNNYVQNNNNQTSRSIIDFFTGRK